MIETIQLIQNVGFPIAMVLYFVFRFEKSIKENTLATQELAIYIKRNKR